MDYNDNFPDQYDETLEEDIEIEAVELEDGTVAVEVTDVVIDAVEPVLDGDALDEADEASEDETVYADDELLADVVGSVAEGVVEHDLASAIEAMLFITNDPVDARTLADQLGAPIDQVDEALRSLQESFAQQDRGIQLNERAGGWRLVTHPRYHELLEKYVVSWDKRKLSQAALETLAIVAYCQPVTRNDVSAIRGVSSDSSVSSLVEKGYLREVGVMEPPSNATLYGTTKTFLERFGLRSINDLPDLESFAPDEATRTLISERLGLVKEQTQTYQVEEDSERDMLEALTGALGAVEKIDFDTIRFDEE